MSGKQFLETLRQLGYPDAHKLNHEMFNWIFDNDSVSPFLHWFCNSVSPSNLLNGEERKQFQDLESTAEGVLEGEVLEEALRSFTPRTGETETVESLREVVSRLTEEEDSCERKKHMLLHQRDRMSKHHLSLGHRLSRLATLESQAKREHQKMLEELESDNTELNESLDGLVRSVTKVHTLYEQPVLSAIHQNSSVEPLFLSHAELSDYFTMEDRFSHELKLFTRKRFFEGIADMAGQNETTKYELLDISNPECLLMKGERQDVIIRNSKELARLKLLYPMTQTNLIKAEIRERQAAALVNHAEKNLKQIKRGEFPTNMTKLREVLHECQMSLNAVKPDLARLQQTDIPALINKSAELWGTNIITGDYKLKLSRQGYFTANQDQLIEQLIVQRARNEFLTMAYEIEARNHRDLHRLLTATRKTLQGHLTEWQHREKAMNDPSLTTGMQPRSTIDSRDKATARLHHILTCGESVEERPQLFLTYAGMMEGAEKLYHKHVSARDDLQASMDKHEGKTVRLEKEMQMCVDHLYHGSSTSSGQPTLTPPMLQETMTQLDIMLTKLESSIMDLLKEYDGKKKLLQSSPMEAKDRELFTYFLTRPDKLQQTVDIITERLEAQSVH